MAKIFDMGRGQYKLEDFTVQNWTAPPNDLYTFSVGVPVEILQQWVGDPQHDNNQPWSITVTDYPPNPIEQQPFTAKYEEILKRFGVRSQSIPLPEGLEMVKEGQIEEVVGEDVKLEFRIKGPTISKELLANMPPEVLMRFDYELKMAVIRAFNMQPVAERKRMLILDSEE